MIPLDDEDAIDQAVEEWHSGDGQGLELHEFLGWSEDEYSEYMCKHLPEKVTRKVFICRHCEGIYADEPITQCDCNLSLKFEFYEGNWCIINDRIYRSTHYLRLCKRRYCRYSEDSKISFAG